MPPTDDSALSFTSPAAGSATVAPAAGGATPVPAALVTFFQQEAGEYLDRLGQVVAADGAPPDLGAFLAHARALRGSAAMARLDGIAELAATVERVGAALRDGEAQWDQRLQFAVRGAIAELRALVEAAPGWSDAEARRARQQSVALGSVAAGTMRTPVATTAPEPAPAAADADRVVPIATLFPDDGQPGVVFRAPVPPMTAGQRFRAELATLAPPLAEAAQALRTASPALAAAARGPVVRAVLAIGRCAEGFGAASVVTLAQRIAAARLDTAAELAALDAFARLLGDHELEDAELAARIRAQRALWGTPGSGGTPAIPSPAVPAPAVPGRPPTSPPSPAPGGAPRPVAPTPPPTAAAAEAPPVSIDTLLYRGSSALARAVEVRDALRVALARSPSFADPTVRALLDELLDLVGLAQQADASTPPSAR